MNAMETYEKRYCERCREEYVNPCDSIEEKMLCIMAQTVDSLDYMIERLETDRIERREGL